MKKEVELTAEQQKEVEEKAFNDLIEEKCIELSKKYGVSKVHAYVGISETGEKVIGFLKEPNYIQKIATMDKITTTGPFLAGDELRQAITLKEDSDPRTYNESPDCDAYRLGMTGMCVPIINVIQNTFKKK